MHFAIGTKNIPKSSAIEHVLTTSPYTSGATFSNHTVVSGVPDMPTTLEELRTGAKNRAIHTRREYPQADYFVGMEGGVYQDYEGETYWLLGIVYIENQEREGHYGYSCHIEVPKAVVDGLFDGGGRDLEQVVHTLGGEANIGDKQGSFHAWTDGMLTRRDQFIMATQCAIAPFFNEFYKKTPSPTQEMLLQKATEINKKFGSQFIPPRGNQTMKYYFLEPEVAGGLGEKSIIDSTIHPPKVDKLQYIFSGWLGDAILESFPCVIVTQGASDALQDNQVTGMEFADVEVLTSSEFRELYPEGNLPSFKWLKVNGKPGKDDFGIADDGRLVISARVLKLLQPFGITHALITDFISSKKTG